MKPLLIASILLLFSCSDSSDSDDSSNSFSTKVELGESLFKDSNLSLNRTQSCSTCHNPAHAFIDNREDDGTLGHSGKIAAVSLGDDNSSLGDRNTPTASYALFSPDFIANTSHDRPTNVTTGSQQTYNGAVGGQFLDGRKLDLKGQAGGPPLNPVEMGMPSKTAVIERINENSAYINAFKALFGESVFDDTDTAYAAMTESIEAFEKTEEFSPFDSKYDRWLNDEYSMSLKELGGKNLFFMGGMNCTSCHQLKSLESDNETFTSYEYHNIGIPENTDARSANGKTEIDAGLMANPELSTDITQLGKFKVPTLRNVAVTEPYMHNGVFRDLKTVIEFYDHFVNPEIRANNPETGIAWRDPETSDTVDLSALNASAVHMNDLQVEQMVCFLRLLTDEKYEHLIKEKSIVCANPT